VSNRPSQGHWRRAFPRPRRGVLPKRSMTAVLLLAQLRGSNWGYTDAQPTSPTAIAPGSLPWHPISVGCALIIHLIIQTILLDPSRAVWNDSASNVSSLDPSGADQVDAEHPTRNRKATAFSPARFAMQVCRPLLGV
jgi:hypothetical protein